MILSLKNFAVNLEEACSCDSEVNRIYAFMHVFIREFLPLTNFSHVTCFC